VSQLKGDLERIVAEAADSGVDLVLLTYPADAGFYSLAYATIREVARATNTRLIDLAAEFKPACPTPASTTGLEGPGATCPELFPDQHPTALGHEQAAKILLEKLVPVLQ